MQANYYTNCLERKPFVRAHGLTKGMVQRMIELIQQFIFFPIQYSKANFVLFRTWGLNVEQYADDLWTRSPKLVIVYFATLSIFITYRLVILAEWSA